MADSGIPSGYKRVTGALDQPAAQALATPTPVGPTAGQTAAGLARDFGGSAISLGGGGLLEAGAQALRALTPGARAADMLSGAGRAVSDYGRSLQEGASQPYRELTAGTQISGELLQPSTWDFGENPSLTGAASLLAQGLGSTVPTLATGAITRGRLAPSAAVAAGVGGGAAAQGERQRLQDMSDDEIAQLPGYQALLAETGDAAAARAQLAEQSASSVFRHTAPVSAADVLSQVLPFTRGAQQALARAVGPGRLRRTAAGAVTGGLSEAAQEVAESAATRLGSNRVTGEELPLFEDTLENALLGAGVGGLLGAGGAVTTSREQAQAELDAAEAERAARAAPAPGSAPPPAPVPVEVEETIVDPADGPLSRIVATEAAAELGSPVVTPVMVSTPRADEMALQLQEEQRATFDRDQQREARRAESQRQRAQQQAANDEAAEAGRDGPLFITLAMRRDLRALGYSNTDIAAMKPADAWQILSESGAESATPAAAAATTEEQTDGIPAADDGGARAGEPGTGAAAPEGTAPEEGAAAEGQEEGQGQQGQEEGAAGPGSGTGGVRQLPEVDSDTTPAETTPDESREPAPTGAAPAADVAGDQVDAGSISAPAGEPGAGPVPADAAAEGGAAVPAEVEPAVVGDPAPEGEEAAAGAVTGDAGAAGAVTDAAGDAADQSGVGSPVGDGDGAALQEGLTDEAQTNAAGPAAGATGTEAGGAAGAGDTSAGGGVDNADGGAESGVGPAAVPGGGAGAAGDVDGDADRRADAGEPVGPDRDDQPAATGPLTESEWSATNPAVRRQAIDRVIAAGGMRAGLTPRVLWKNLTDSERAALGPIVRELTGAATAPADTATTSEQPPAAGAATAPAGADAAPAGDAPSGQPEPAAAETAPPSPPGSEPGAGQGSEAGADGGASDASLEAAGGEPAADATDPSAPRVGGANDTTETGTDGTASVDAGASTQGDSAPETGQRPDRLEDAGEELVGARSWRNKLRESRTDDRAKDAAKLLDTVTRAAALRIRVGEGATPGTERYIELVRGIFRPFTDFAVRQVEVYDRDTPRQSLIAEMSSSQSVYDQVEQAAAEYMATLAQFAAPLDGVTSVAEAHARVTETLFRKAPEGDTPAFFSDFGSSLEDAYFASEIYSARSAYRLINGWAEAVKMNETEEVQKRARPLVRPKLESLEREGLPDHRKGKDVTAEDLVETFGFRGVNYGNYVNARERQAHTNHAYDALMDLAGVMGIPPKAVSLGGTLGLSIGKEGSGKAAAHYEPGTKIINITKGRGDGSVAHEWAHALSDSLRERLKSSGRARAAQSVRSHLHTTLSLEKLKWRVDQLLRGETSIKNNKRKGPKGSAEALLEYEYWDHPSWNVKLETAYKRASDEIGKSYWGDPDEMWARAFEAWVYDRLDGYSPYLVSDWVADGAVTKESGYRGRPFPTGDERAAFHADFDAIKAALIVDEDGGLSLSPDYKTPTERQLDAIREWSRWALANLDSLYEKAVGGHPSHLGLFWYRGKQGRDTGKVPRGYHAHIDLAGSKVTYVGYPEPLTVAQVESFKLEATEMAARDDIVVDETTPNAGFDYNPLVAELVRRIARGDMPADNTALRKFLNEFDGSAPSSARMKQGQEALEVAIVSRARELVARGTDDRATFDQLLELYNSQPLLNVRTSTSVANQAYSTPAPLAFLASRLAGIDYTTKVYEPTAGNGMLLIGAAPANVSANELNEDRHRALVAQGFNTREGDALSAVGDLVQPGTQDAVISNPPFDSIRDADGKPTKRKVDGYSLSKLDHLIVADALRAMKDDGKATLIIGANMPAGAITDADRVFFNWLYSHYNVTGHIEVDGALYARQGASWPVRVITINGRVASDRVTPKPGDIARVNNWNDVYEHFEAVLGAQERAVERTDDSGGGQGAGRSGTGSGDLTLGDGASGRDGGEGGTSVRGRGGRGGRGAGGVSGEPDGAGSDQAQRAGEQLADGADEQRADDAAAEQDQVGEGGDGADTTEPDARRNQVRPPRANASGADRSTLTDAENAFQTGYEPRSSRKDEGVLVPVNMAQPLQDALSDLEDAVGDIDAFVARELGYKSEDEMHKALMGLQVDSVASAIYQNKVRKKGIIIADQTGIGKGRQAAAMIRWAIKQGMTPVFVTVKPSLFTDMMRDLTDIGSKDVKPFLLNKDEWITGADGKRLFANVKSKHKGVLEKIVSDGELPSGRNAMFMTYSQINVENLQRRVLTALAEKAFFVLDESHNAGGDSQTGAFVREVLQGAAGVVYLSATYAKRPDNMPVYFRTDIGDAIEGGSEALIDAMAAGGLPLQTVVANGLVRSGQMFRRERSYDGVKIETVVDTANRKAHEELSDRVTSALRAIVEADGAFHDGYMAAMEKQVKERGEALGRAAGNQARESVNHTEFSSVVHNFVKQLLLGLKADTAADRAIAELRAGKKPLIALENTMGSFLAQYAADNGLKDGDLLGSFDYRTVLTRALDRTRYYTLKDAKGNSERIYVPLSELDPNTRRIYQAAQNTIDQLDGLSDLPVSPLDWIRHRITQAGFTVAEITGRNLAVDYSGEAPRLTRVPDEEQNDKVKTTARFNDGTLDAIILNVSGSTGISLHASENFKDKRQRHMIVAQPASDINIFMQMLGRIHRTGQVVLPEYSILNADLPAEKRPTAVLNKKMKSLNANTSSNSESATSIKAADFLNKYGDQIVNDYLVDNPDLARALDLTPAEQDGDRPARVPEDIARKATGRLALMPVATQLAFYEDIEAQYNALIDYLNETNQNDLEPRTLDFEAELSHEHVILEATNPNSPFGGEAVYGEYRIKAQGKAMTPDEIRAEQAKALGGKTPEQFTENLIARLEKDAPKPKQPDPDAPIGQRHVVEDPVVVAGRNFLRGHQIGSLWRVEINGDVYNATVLDVRNSHKGSGNPFSLSKTQVVLAVNGPLRSIVVPASQWSKIEIAPISGWGVTLDSVFREQAQGTQIAKIITGNLLGAYGEMRGTSSQIITFTKKDGSIEQGILLPKKFELEKNTYGDYHFRSPDDLIRFLSTTTNPDADRFGVASRDQNVRVQMENDGSLRISVPKSRARGGKFFLNKRLLEHTGDFVSSGDSMRATVPKDKAAAALEVLMSNTAIYAPPSMAEEARAILSTPRGAQSRPAPGARTGWVDTGVLDRAVQRVMSSWRGDIPVVRTVTLAEELPAEAKRHRGWETAEGWYDGSGTVYLVANNIPNVTRGLQVLAHEAIGHYGVEAVMGKAQWTQVVGDVAKLRRRRDRLSPAMQGAMDSAVRRYGNESASTFAREFLAILAERNVKTSLLARVFAAVRRWLRSMGFPVDAWAADELQTIVAEGAKQVTKRRRARQAGDRRGSAFAERASPFFSAMVEAVERAQGAPRQADARAWKGWLDGAQRRGEFKQAERDWLGVDAWLDQQDGPVSRDAIAGYVRDHQVRIEEVNLGGPDPDVVARLPDGWTVEFDPRPGLWVVRDADGELMGEGNTSNDAIRDTMDRDEAADIPDATGETRYQQYQLPGGTNYRELLLTLPPRAGATDRRAQLENDRLVRGLSEDEWAELRELRAGSAREPGVVPQDDTFRSSHWEQPNVLAHVRFNERTDVDGKRVLFIEEIQSDWHQAGRKRGYAKPKRSIEEIEADRSRLNRERSAVRDEAAALPDAEMQRFRELMAREAELRQELLAVEDEWTAAMGADGSVPDAPFKGTDEWAMLAFKRMVRHAAENGFDRIAWTPGEVQAQRYDLSQQVDSLLYAKNDDGTYAVSAITRSRGNMLGESIPEDRLEDYVGKEIAKKIVAGEGQRTQVQGKRPYMQELSGVDLKVGGEGMRAFYDNILPKAVNKWAKRLGGRVEQTRIMPSAMKPGASKRNPIAVHALDVTDAMREVALAGLPLFSRPETEFGIYDTRGKELDRAATLPEAHRRASRLRHAGKRVGEVRPIAPPETGIDAPRLPVGIVLRTDPDTGVTMQEFPETRRALDAAMATGDLSQLLEAVAKQADGDKRLGADYAYFARKLAPMMRALGVKLVAPPADADYAGAYRIGSNDVWIRQALPEIIIHEALHAATSASLTSRSLRNASPVVRKAVAEFNDLLAAAQAHAAGLDMATLPPALRTMLENPSGPLSNTKELLAYGMSSRTFQNWLDSIPAPADRKPKTAFEWLKDLVGRVVGGQRVTGSRETLLGALIESGSDLIDFASNNPVAVRMARLSEGVRLGGSMDPSAITSAVRRGGAAAGRAADAIDETLRPDNPIPDRFDAEQRAAAEKFDTFRRKERFTDRIEKIKDRAGARFVQKVFDQFRPLKDLNPTAFMQAHLSKATDGTLEAVFEHGIPVVREGAFDIGERTGGFRKVLSDLAGEHDQFLMWVAGNRADALANEWTVFVDGEEVSRHPSEEAARAEAARLRALDPTKDIHGRHTNRERLFSDTDIAAMKRLNQGTMADGRSRREVYAQAHRELQRYNKAMLDIAQKAGVIDPAGRRIWESEFYIPFYRVMADDQNNGPGQIKGLLRQQVIKRLRGGTEPLGDPLENILGNWSHLLSASMRNMAATNAMDAALDMGIAEEASAQQKGAVWIMREGKKAWYTVDDPLVLEALESLSFTGYDNPMMRAAGKFKRMLTISVTIDPSFRIRNLTRDMLSAIATADVGFNPIKNAIDGFHGMKTDENGVSLLAGGGAIRFGVINDGNQAAHAKRLIELGIDNKDILDSRSKMLGAMRKAYDWWQEWGDKIETVNRAVIYDRAIKAGRSHLEASFEARDLMNFTSMGSASVIRAMSQVLPFFNARLQGLDRLARGAARDPRRFWAVTGTLAVASALLYLLNADDDDYKKLPDYVRDNYWVLKLPGTDKWVYIPKPFEVGAMATIVERGTEMMLSGGDYKARDFATTLMGVASGTLALNPVPQIARPATEALFNYDMFRQAPIDSMGQQNLLPGDRYTARTSAGAVLAGRAVGVSPQRMEHLVRGYFGWLGVQALHVSDYLLRDVVGMPASPQRDLSRVSNLFVIGNFVKDADATSSKYLTRFYEAQRKIDEIYASARLAARSGDSERLASLLRSPELAARPAYKLADKQLAKINQQIRAVTADPDLSAKEKNARLDELNRQRNMIAMRVDRMVRGLE